MKTKLFLLLMVPLLMVSSVFPDDLWEEEYPNGNSINNIAIQGNYVWCASEGSLVRWDKRDGSYKQYTVKDGLLASRTKTVFVDRDDNVWIGSLRGVQKYDGTSFANYTMETGELPDEYVLAIGQAPDGTMWFGTYGGLVSFDGESWSHFISGDDNPGIPEIYYVSSITVDKNGVIWFPYIANNAYKGIMSFDGKAWTYYTPQNSELITNNIFRIAVDDNNIKWIGTATGLQSFDDETWNTHELPDYKYNLSITDLDIDKNGNVWLATMPGLVSMVPFYPDEKKSILRYDGTTWSELPLNDYLHIPIKGFLHIAVDDEGTPWFVSLNNGFDAHTLYSYDESGLTEYLVEGPRSYIFKDLFVDRNNAKWFGTSYGICKYENGSWEDLLYILPQDEYRYETYQGERHYNSMYFTETNNIESITQDHDGVLWFATGFGIRSFDGTTWTQYSEVNVDVIPNTASLFAFVGVDNNNVKYFLSPKFLLKYDGQIWERDDWLKDNFSSGNMLMGFTYAAIDHENVLWLINYEGKVVRYDGDSWDVFLEDTTGITGMGYCCAVDQNNVKWFGTRGGLYSFDGVSWKTHLNEEVAGSNITIPNIIVDENNVLWIINNKQLQSYDGNSLVTYIDELSGFTLRMALDHDGYIWICGLEGASSNGMVSFNKNAAMTAVDSENKLPVAVNITGNYPNPFNPSTTINFALNDGGFTSVLIYNIMGQKVRTLVSEFLNPGVHEIVWDGRDESGNAVSSGVYMCRLKMGEQAVTKQMMMLK
ncbi:MAG: T9SS type A sorting domain-containing protein [Candidatus Latescibacteria bacterium]|nr:T9SS type A sorting domain-containing protein [Candidatus Latescibacterota bacterium]